MVTVKKITTFYGLPILALIGITLVIGIFGVDVKIASLCFVDGQGFVHGGKFPWLLLNHWGEIPAYLLALAAFITLVAGHFFSAIKIYQSASIFLVLLLILGQVFFVNFIFKGHWGRPRPAAIIEFGGKQHFAHPWQVNSSGSGKSFPSGHTSLAFYMAAPYFLLRKTQLRQSLFWLVGGCSYGVLMSVARILQGKHFLSDVVWSGGIMFLSAELLLVFLSLMTQLVGNKQQISPCPLLVSHRHEG